MAKKFNPVAYVTNAARKAWLWSEVRKAAVKPFCEECGATGKLVIHHKIEANVYAKIKEAIKLLIPETPGNLDCLCKDCHKKAHNNLKGL